MKQKFYSSLALMILCAFAMVAVIGCGGGGSGTSGGDVPPIPTPFPTGGTGTINQANAKQVGWDVYNQAFSNPQSTYTPDVQNGQQIFEMMVNHINEEIASGKKATHTINKVIMDPHDADGTLVISGEYTYDAQTRSWNASLSLVYTDFYVKLPQYTPSEYNANGALTVQISYDQTLGIMEASLAYAGYHLDSESNSYEYTGSIAQSGKLENRKLVSYTAEAAMTLSSSVEGSLVIAVSTNAQINPDTGEVTLSVSGSMTYSGYNGATGVAIIETEIPLVVTATGDTTEGIITVTDIYGNELIIEITDTNTVSITLNGIEVFSGDLEEFYQIPEPQQ